MKEEHPTFSLPYTFLPTALNQLLPNPIFYAFFGPLSMTVRIVLSSREDSLMGRPKHKDTPPLPQPRTGRSVSLFFPLSSRYLRDMLTCLPFSFFSPIPIETPLPSHTPPPGSPDSRECDGSSFFLFYALLFLKVLVLFSLRSLPPPTVKPSSTASAIPLLPQ